MSCVAVRSHSLIEQRYLPALAQAGIDAVELKGVDESSLPSAVRISTMHRVKGLEFPCVLLASVQAGEIGRVTNKEFGDEASRDAYVATDRRLLYVAATRARDELVITGFGERSPLVPGSG
jgi:superfamily I DNA/RNA helicase